MDTSAKAQERLGGNEYYDHGYNPPALTVLRLIPSGDPSPALEERGVLDIASSLVPILVPVTMFPFKAFSSPDLGQRAAARDGARAAMLGRPEQAGHEALPTVGAPGISVGWLRFRALCPGHRSGADRYPSHHH